MTAAVVRGWYGDDCWPGDPTGPRWRNPLRRGAASAQPRLRVEQPRGSAVPPAAYRRGRTSVAAVDLVAELRPSKRRAGWIALGVGTPVIFAVFFVGLVVTNGSPWSYAWAALGYVLAWIRACQVAVVADEQHVTVKNFYGSTVLLRDRAQHVEPFSYWLNPNWSCMAVVTSTKRKPMHATALAGRQAAYEAEARVTASQLLLPLKKL